MFVKSGFKEAHLQAARIIRTVDAIVAWWTCRATVTGETAAEFGVYAVRVVILPASGTARAAFQPQHQHHVGEGCHNRQRDVQTQSHCAVVSSSHPPLPRETPLCGGFVDWVWAAIEQVDGGGCLKDLNCQVGSEINAVVNDGSLQFHLCWSLHNSVWQFECECRQLIGTSRSSHIPGRFGNVI